MLGVLLGTLIGVLPGIGALAAISMLFPLTFQLDATTALIMLAGIWYGASYGGATTSIMLNVPGTATNAITAIDGHPLAKSGRAGVALFMATIASFCGGTIGIIFMMVFAPVVAIYANDFGPAEYFALMLLGLVAASTMSDGKPQKGYAMVCLGLFLGTIGLDLNSGAARFQFGMLELTEGIELAALAMGLFGIPEIIASLRVGSQRTPLREKVTFRSMVPTREDWRHFPKAMGRGSGMGVFFGTLPGTGPTIAAFLAYVAEKKLARDPSRFGKGAIEGVVAPESANNAGDMTAFIPTLTLGIPGSATMAIMLGALMIHGITPGPTMMSDHPDVFWGLVMSFWIGNIMLLVINIPLLGIWVRMLSIPYKYLYPAILMFVCMGVYGIGNSTFDVWMVFAFGALGYLLRVLAFPLIPLLLGFVLGPPMEQNFRTAVVLFRGDMTPFLTEPISGVIMVLTLAIALLGVLPGLKRMIRKRRGRYDAV
ncbi:tripartite tricarboxylate transporter permease [Amorphus sp. MBR-141]